MKGLSRHGPIDHRQGGTYCYAYFRDSTLERAGLIKTFEFCFELSWNVLKDLLHYEGHEVKVPRAAIRRAFEDRYYPVPLRLYRTLDAKRTP